MASNTEFEMTEKIANLVNNNEVTVDVRPKSPTEANNWFNLGKATFAKFLGTIIYVFLAMNTEYYSISPALALVGLVVMFGKVR